MLFKKKLHNKKKSSAKSILLFGLIPFSYTGCRYYLNRFSFIKYLLTEAGLWVLISYYSGMGCFCFLQGFFTFYLIYEVGYIDNDFTSKRKCGEVTRVSSHFASMTNQLAKAIVAVRIMTVLIYCIALSKIMRSEDHDKFLITMFCNIFVLLLFVAFNRASEYLMRSGLFVVLAFSKPLLINLFGVIGGFGCVSTKSWYFSVLLAAPYNIKKTHQYLFLKFPDRILANIFFEISLVLSMLFLYFRLEYKGLLQMLLEFAISLAPVGFQVACDRFKKTKIFTNVNGVWQLNKNAHAQKSV
jgi:hypothetical protein